MSSEELLLSLEKNISNLLQERENLRQEVSQLTDANRRQREEMIRTHAELEELKREYNQLRMAHAMVADTPEREAVKRQLTRMIHIVDKAIENLKAVE
ncbi:MAG: hypothetical protein IJ776_07090 [Paludibacteraceae bacterium]|nr:hypothetical protein [Paludibacteraceae bacterium]